MARDVAACERMLAALAPGFVPVEAPAPAELRAGIAWLEGAEPLVRARVEDAASHFGSVVPLDVPLPVDTYAQFAREAADVHRELFAERRAEYGPNVAAKLERAMGITTEQAQAAAVVRDRYREQVAALMEDVDLLVAPTMEMVAPASGLGDLVLRERMIKLTYPSNATGAPALALPCGSAEDGLPASIQLIGRVGEDAAVLAAGRALEAALNPS